MTIQYPYEYLIITLTDNQTIISEKRITKFQAIGQLIPTIQNVLEEKNLNLSDIACIAINTGPGPFNTLRSIIATANAIAFAQKIPLISCNGLDLILDQTPINTIAILDAFSNDVYYAIKRTNQQGYCTIQNLIKKLNFDYKNKPLYFIGNGATKHFDFITQNFCSTTTIDKTILFASSDQLIKQTYKKYMQKEFETQIFPLYFATPVIKP